MSETVIMLSAFAALLTLATPMHADRLRTEYLVDPLAIQTTKPRFSWECADSSFGARQTAYQVVVQSDSKTLWDTGKVASTDQGQVEYSGQALTSGEACTWKVRLWGADGKAGDWRSATFRVGLLQPGAWQGDWITTPELVPPIRPADNGYHSELAASADQPKWVMIDLGASREFDSVALWPARPFDWQPDTPGFLFPVRFRIEVSDDPGFSAPRRVVTREDLDFTNPGEREVSFATPGARGRYVRLIVSKLAERDPGHFGFALAEFQILKGTTDLALKAQVTASDGLRDHSWSPDRLVDGDLTSHGLLGLDSLPVTQLRKEFTIEHKIKRATLYATALGAYEASINGQRVGDHILAPEWTDYTTRVQYQAYDVTRLLKSGRNAMGALLGDGWYAGRIGMAQALDPRGFPRAVYGRRAWFRSQLVVDYQDGSTLTIPSDKTWSSTTAGPIRSSDIYDGESVDLSKTMSDWDKPGFQADGWKGVAATQQSVAVVAQPNEAIRVVDELKPVSVSEPRPGVFVLDMGQNMVGWLKADLRAAPGATVTLQYAEMLNEDGTVYTANLRGAPQRDHVTLPSTGSVRGWRPHFTYHGFRYVQIEGLAGKPEARDFVGEVFCSSSPESSTFECSSPMVNRLWANIFWTQRANLMSVPTDCPQRDERLGWMGDILAFCQTACFNMDMEGFFTKWLQDVRDAQADDGRYPDFSPHPYGKNDRFTGVPGWGDAGVVCAWVDYLNSGDVRLLADHFDSTKRWVDWIASRNPDWVWAKDRHNDYGDWLNGNTLVRQGWDSTGGEVPKEVFATLMWYQSVRMVAHIAEVVGAGKDAARYRDEAARIKDAFNRRFVKDDGSILGDTQAGYALALHMGILPPGLEDQAFNKLVEAIERRKGVLTTGFHSTLPMMEVLTQRGRNDLAYKLLLNTDFPSWGYTIENGATTIWERWDGYVKGRGFQDPGMNSFNHWALGSVGEWVMETLGGVRPGKPGWSEFTIAPVPGPGIDWAKATFRTPRGKVSVSWKKSGETVDLEFTVPANTRAIVRPPAVGKGQVTFVDGQPEGGKQADGSFRVGAGHFRIRLT